MYIIIIITNKMQLLSQLKINTPNILHFQHVSKIMIKKLVFEQKYGQKTSIWAKTWIKN